jgi:hypothetical protein
MIPHYVARMSSETRDVDPVGGWRTLEFTGVHSQSCACGLLITGVPQDVHELMKTHCERGVSGNLR